MKRTEFSSVQSLMGEIEKYANANVKSRVKEVLEREIDALKAEIIADLDDLIKISIYENTQFAPYSGLEVRVLFLGWNNNKEVK